MIVTSLQMKQIEEQFLNYGLSMERLMENAGSAAATAIRRLFDVEGKFITLFCGRGNNGGDGFVVARRLTEWGANAVVVLTDGPPKTEQSKEMLERLTYMELATVEYGTDMEYLTQRLAETDLLIDAIYGSGFHGSLDEKHSSICRLMNGVGVPIVSLDIPSGVNADTGAADPQAIAATHTIVFDSQKPATVLPMTAQYCGQVHLADIGIPEEAHQGIQENFVLMDDAYVFTKLKKRQRNTHKGDYGRLLVVGGCQRYMGAVVLSTLAAMRCGAGYVTLASTKEVCRTTLARLPEAVMLPLHQTPTGDISAEDLDTLLEAAKHSTAILAGNGLGTGTDAQIIIGALLTHAQCPVILDADGINCLAMNITWLQQKTCPLILTPHCKEFSRLTGKSVPTLKSAAVLESLAFAKEHNATVALKDAYTVTAAPDSTIYINTTGNAGLAKAGSGDVLAGIIGALAAQGVSPTDAAACGVWLHGMAGDYAARNYSQYGMLARDVIGELCNVFSDYDR